MARSFADLFLNCLAPKSSHQVKEPSGYSSHRTASSAQIDPALQLVKSSDGSIRVFGFPDRGADLRGTNVLRRVTRDATQAQPFLYLRTRCPAFVNYIMGPDWPDRLTNEDIIAAQQSWRPTGVILRPITTGTKTPLSSDTGLTSERERCQKMRRCGAVLVYALKDIKHHEAHGEMRFDPILGWPSDGGVWILRSPPDKDPNDPYTLRSEVKLIENYERAEKEIESQLDMAGVCAALERAGAQFYANELDCEEVEKHRLFI